MADFWKADCQAFFPKLDRSLSQLAEFSAWLDDNDTDLLSFLAALDSTSRALVGAAPELRAAHASLPVFIDEFASFQIRVDSNLGALVEDGADVLELVAARSGSLQSIIRGLEAFTTIWNSGLSQPCSGEYDFDLVCWQVYLVPGKDSRGLYGPGQGPDADEAGDPNFGSNSAAAITTEDVAAALQSGPALADPEIVRLLTERANDLMQSGRWMK